jgi:hypothetical protein
MNQLKQTIILSKLLRAYKMVVYKWFQLQQQAEHLMFGQKESGTILP